MDLHYIFTLTKLNFMTQKQINEKMEELAALRMGNSDNPLISRLSKIPGVTVRLPSAGIFYLNGELDEEVKNGEIILFPLTASDELMLRSPDMLYQGTTIEAVFRHCAPQIKEPLELLVGDVDYILTNLRKISYGTHIPIRYICDCIESEEQREDIRIAGDDEYLIPVDHFIQNSKELNIKTFKSTFVVKLANGMEVTTQPVRFSDFIKLNQVREEDLEDQEFLRNYVADNLTAITLKVDEITDKKLIKEWYSVLPRLEVERIKNKLNSQSPWGIEFKYKVECKHCKEEKELTHHLNPVYFFMLPSSPETLNY